MGSCIGVAVVGKKEKSIVHVGVAHIDPLTDLSSVGDFVKRATNGAISADVFMLSSGNDVKRASDILEQLACFTELYHIEMKIKSKLDGTLSFAINVLDGTVYRDIPMRCFVTNGVIDFDKLDKMCSVAGPLRLSAFYDKGLVR